MRILLRKLSDERHELAVSREPASWEAMECETRSYLTHDLLHYAVEAEAGMESGFWGRLAAGATLVEMNDRTRSMSPEMAAIEQIVGALTPSVKGRSAADVVAGMNRFASSLGTTMPSWLTESFVLAVQERMRQLFGRWNATPCGSALDLAWPGARTPAPR
jgi:hypothetical protein